MANEKVRVRMAPSPTGPFHIGSARTALFNWLFARQHGGVFVVRIEDTDTERSKKEHENDALESLKWLGLVWDEGPAVEGSGSKDKSYIGNCGPYRQSERTEIYKEYLKKLLDEEKAYYCYCTKEDLEAQKQAMLGQGLPPKYNGHCRNTTPPAGKKPEVIRFKTPEARVEFNDLVRGKVSFDASLFGDIVIAKNLDTPLYNFAVVVDDEEMKITHVIRGEDHLSNTPKQILFQRALGFTEPHYAHIPLILNPDRSKMSKRFSDIALSDYKEQGYMPEALVNFLALLGWHPKDDKELFTLSELAEVFDLKRVQKAGAIFNQEKLDWLQREHMKQMSTKHVMDGLGALLKEKGVSVSRTFLERIVVLERSRMKTIPEFLSTAGFFFELSDYGPDLLAWQNAPASKTKIVLQETLRILSEFDAKEFNKESLLVVLGGVIQKEGRGEVLWPLRVALSGLRASPDPTEIMEVLGKDETLKRIKSAINKIKV
jgi:nondiscriminating glutamyl-tRNA synthetase